MQEQRSQDFGPFPRALVYKLWRRKTKMSEVKSEEVGHLKIGGYVIFDEAACRISKMERSSPGKHGHAKYRVEAIGLLDNQKRIQVLTGHAKVDVPIIEKKNAQVLSVSNDKAQLMDITSYETFEAPIPEELKGEVIAGGTVLYWDILGTKVIKQLK